MALGLFDVFRLALFRPATEQDHELVSVLPEIDPITKAKRDAPFRHALPNWLHIAKVAGLNPGEGGSRLQCRSCAEAVELALEGRVAIFGDV